MATRALAEPAKVQRAAEPGRPPASSSSRRIQPSLQVSQPNDAAEREAESTARKVMAMRTPAVAPRERVSILAARAPAPAPAPAAAPPDDSRTSPDLTAAIKAELGGGSGLPLEVRGFMEPRFKADLTGIRIHTDARAENLTTRLGARAFTYGRDIFFNRGQFQPDTDTGMELVAHELTHTIQQREVVQREVAIKETSAPRVQRGIVSRALDWIADKANYIPGFRLFTVIIGLNPINMSKVDRSGANILRALVEFLPGGGLIVDALDNYGIFEKGGKFIEDQFRTLGMVGSMFRDALMDFIDSLGWRDVFHLGDVWDRAKRIFTDPIDRLINFGKSLVAGVITIIKDAILKPLAALVSKTRAWDLLCAVMGKNPITGEKVERSADTLIGGFMKLIGQEEIWNNIKRANAISRAWNWFKTALNGLLNLVMSIPDRFITALKSLVIMDIVIITRVFTKVGGVFAGFIGDFLSWAGGTVLSLLEIILDVVAPAAVPYLKKAGAAFKTIIKNPVGFVRTLVRAAVQGFKQFASNFLSHLKAALVQWLTGSLGGLGIYIPTGFTLLEILKFVLSVMGLTWTNIRAKLVKATNETVVKVLETTFDIVKTLVTEGPAAAWQKIVETLTNLKEMAIDAIMDFVKSKVVEAAVTKLLSMLSPAGAFIQAIIAIYNTIMFFVERIRQIAQVAASFIDGIAAIAAGNIAPAANRVEQTMAGLLVLVISFLARIAGLGKVSDAIKGLIDKIRTPIDKALDKVVEWIVTTAKNLGKMAKEGVKSILNWWKAEKKMNLGDGDSHTLSFRGTEKNARLTLASVEKPVEDHLNEAAVDPALSKAAQGRAKAALAFYTANIAPISGVTIPDPTPPALQAKIDALPDNLNALAVKLSAISDPDIDFPAAITSWAGPGSASIEKLSNRTSRGGQDARAGMPKGWALIVQRGLTARNGNWVRMHMISAGFGGLDIAGNLVPTPTAVNTGGSVRGFERQVEKVFYGDDKAGDVRAAKSLFKRLKARQAVLWVKTTTGGFWPAGNDPLTGKPLYDASTFVTSVALQAGLYYPREGMWTKDPNVLASGGAPVPKPDFSGAYVPNINGLGEPTLAKLAEIPPHFAREIVARGPFTSPTNFNQRMRTGRSGEDIAITPELRAAMAAVVSAVSANKMKWRD